LSGWGQAADLYQFETECFELSKHPIEAGLIGEKARQDGVATLDFRTQGRERQPDRLAQVPADPDFVVVLHRPSQPIAVHAGLVIIAYDRPQKQPP
jgi:hypothetical protein